MSARCRILEERFLAGGEEALRASAEMQAHLAECPQCAAVFARLAEVERGLALLGRAEAPMIGLDEGAIVKASASKADEDEPTWHLEDDRHGKGPLPLAVLERLWEDNAINLDTLVWRAGMADWLPIGDVPELAHLRAARAEHANPTASAEGTIQIHAPEQTFTPLAAQSLKALAADELVARTVSKEPTAPTAPARPASLPDVLAVTPLAQASAPLPSWSIPPAPAPRQRLRPIHWIIGVAGSSVVAAAATAIVLLSVRPDLERPAQQMASAPTTAAPGATAASPLPSASVTVPATTPAAAPREMKPDKPSETGAVPAPALQPKPAAPREEPQPRHDVGRRAAADDEDRGVGRKAKARGPAAVPAESRPESPPAAKVALTREDIMAAVKTSGASVIPCLRAARAKGEIVPGAYTFTLDWTVTPDGSVAKPRLRGPAEVLNTSLPACFARAMSSWRFPASQRELPVANFPFGPVKIP